MMQLRWCRIKAQCLPVNACMMRPDHPLTLASPRKPGALRGPVDGMAIAVKDNFCVQACLSRRGSLQQSLLPSGPP